MPELPEIEVLKRSLESHLRDRSLTRVTVHRHDLRVPVDEAGLRRLCGQPIEGLERRAKYLLLRFRGGSHLLVHLGMSGRLTLSDETATRHRHEHVAFSVDDGRRLRFVDPRRFGLLLGLSAAELAVEPRLAGLGAEPLSAGFTGNTLLAAARGRRGPVKGLLMNPAVVVGIGNIYASEALHDAGIHPARSVARIALPRWHRLADAIRNVLQAAIDHGGTTLADFVDGEGRAGGNRPALAVYGREGQPCRHCRRMVRRRRQGGRSTFYCPGCQR